MGAGGRVNVTLFTNAQGKPAGAIRTYKHGTLARDTAGHGGAYYKLYWSKSGGYYSLTSDGTVLRWKQVPSMAYGTTLVGPSA